MKHLPAGRFAPLRAPLLAALALAAASPAPARDDPAPPRERIPINDGWRFQQGDPAGYPACLAYDRRPGASGANDATPAAPAAVLKPWILPTGNPFIKDPAKHYARPAANPGGDCPFVGSDFDDSSWRNVNLPHDWAIHGPFKAGPGGGMGRLPSHGVGWYRKNLDIPATDAGRSIFLEVDGAMSHATVWLNGSLVGGWPAGYSSWRVDLTPHVAPGGANQLAIRLDNPPDSSRWYPGGGIYRNVWLTKVRPVHVAQWGARVTTREVSSTSATVDLEVAIDNASEADAPVAVSTRLFAIDDHGRQAGRPLATVGPLATVVPARGAATVTGSATLANPRLWGPPPTQHPHRHLAVIEVRDADGKLLDRCGQRFGVRTVRFDPATGVHVNGERVFLRGANQHHDLGALGAAFNVRAAERQLEMLREMGCNAIRTAHNPPAPELLELTDRMGFLVVDEAFDAWEREKTPLDAHLLFADWHEQDLRALVRRDRNHPSVILWSIGNEVGEQFTGEPGAALAGRLRGIVREEDPTRPVTAAMNWAKPEMPLPAVLDVISLNYQGEGIRQGPAYAGLQGIRTPPQYPAFHAKFPDKLILASENAATVSSRGEYLFPVFAGAGAPVRDEVGGDPRRAHVSAYELHTADFGSSPDVVFAAEDRHPFVAGGFVWSGWDYLGEPTPYDTSRSSCFGVIDLAGFRKDRFFLYQSRWRPELPVAHILPHWSWPERAGQPTPVHVFTSGDEAELFLNGRSLGRRKLGPNEYRLRWDDVVYQPGELRVVVFKRGARWAEETVKTAGEPARLEASADRPEIAADGRDLSFVTVRVADAAGLTCPRAADRIRFTVDGPGELVATDNGDPTDMTPFPARERAAFNGLCLAIVRGIPNRPGTLRLRAESGALAGDIVTVSTVDDPHPAAAGTTIPAP